MTVRGAVEAREATRKNDLERATDPGRALARAITEGGVSMSGVLAAVGFDASNPTHQAALLVANKLGLDPLLKHVIVIQGKGVYITRDGYLHLAHQSGHLDGIEVLDESETEAHWVAKVAVYRNDMSRPFAYQGRYPKNGSNKQYGPEMAIKCAEVAALRRAFNVSGLGAADETWDKEITDAEVVTEPLADVGIEAGESV